jgi:prepilin-type N-terminal cleavage/methylation domain-containing protein
VTRRPRRDRPRAGRARGQGGFTIVELLVAMTLVTLLIGVAFQVGIVVVTGYREHRQAVAVQRAARGSLDLVADAVRNASAGVPTGQLFDAAGCTPLTAISVINASDGPDELVLIAAAGAVVTSIREPIDQGSASATVLDATGLAVGDLILVTDFDTGHVLRIASIDDQGEQWRLGLEPSTCPGVAFDYPAGALVVRAKVSRFFVDDVEGVPTLFLDPDGDGPEPAEPLAEGVEDFQVAVGVDQDGDGTIADTGSSTDEWFYNDPADGDPPAMTTRPWRALRLTVVARSVQPERGAEWPGRPAIEDREGGAPDAYRRRVVSTVVEIRNLEGSP